MKKAVAGWSELERTADLDVFGFNIPPLLSPFGENGAARSAEDFDSASVVGSAASFLDETLAESVADRYFLLIALLIFIIYLNIVPQVFTP